jgi:hypothetical protein
MKVKCYVAESGGYRVDAIAKDKDYALLDNFLTGCNGLSSILRVLNILNDSIKGIYTPDATSQYDHSNEGVGLNIMKDTVQLEYHLSGIVNSTPLILSIQDFLSATEAYARFLNKNIKERHAKLDWGKEEVAENDKQLKAYFKNKQS